MISDEQLAKLIEAALMHDERLSAHAITVDVSDALVTLAGRVQSFRRKLVAQQIASDFEYVRDVKNQIVVEPAHATPDDEVAAHVRTSLNADADITKEAIAVSVEAGKVTLTGHVGSAWERAQAEDLARSARGVRDVNNLLGINGNEMVADGQMSDQILAALKHARGLRDAGIRVAVSNTAVVLSGEVDHMWQKETAQSVAERFRPLRLLNEIVVRGPHGG